MIEKDIEVVLGVLSDNHGEYYPEIEIHLANCDAIIHCGDIVKSSILERLKNLGPPLYIAFGNNYPTAIRKNSKKVQMLTFDKIGLRVLALHSPGGYFEGALFENPSVFLKEFIELANISAN